MSKAPISPQSQNCTANTLCSQGFDDLVSSLTETVQIETASSPGSDSSGTEGNGNRQCSHSENRHSAPSGLDSVSPGSNPPPPPPMEVHFLGFVGRWGVGSGHMELLFVVRPEWHGIPPRYHSCWEDGMCGRCPSGIQCQGFIGCLAVLTVWPKIHTTQFVIAHTTIRDCPDS